MWWIILLSVIGGLIVLGILLLSIPLDVSWRLEVYGRPKSIFKWTWLLGLLSKEIKAGKRAPEKKKEKPHGKFEISKAVKRIRQASEFLRIKDLISHVIKFSGRILRRIRIRGIEAELRVGLDDPADTFYIFALTEPVNRILNYSSPYPISIQPSFLEPVFEGYCSGSVRIYPIQMVLPALQFVFSVPVFRVIKKVVADRWRRDG